MVKVACAIIRKGDKYLTCRRKTGKTRAGKWEFPGGKIHAGESPEEAIVRELMEELSINVEALEILGDVEYHYPDISIELIALKCSVPEEIIRLTDHDEFQWITFSELKTVEFSEADCRIIDEILLSQL